MTVALVLAVIALVVALIALFTALTAWTEVRTLPVRGSHSKRLPGQSTKSKERSRDTGLPSGSVLALLAEGGFLPATPAPEEGAAADPADPTTPAPVAPHIIFNPAKPVDWERLQHVAARIAREASFAEPVWVATTPEDPGTGQAVAAVRAQVPLVIAAGGDGTVRAVAAGMAHSGIPLGVVPAGTANLLARNIDLPFTDLEEALTIAFTGRDNRMDMGWVRFVDLEAERPRPSEGTLVRQGYEDILPRLTDDALGPGFTSRHRFARDILDLIPLEDEVSFIVMTGMGFDAQIMADTDPELKERIGWWAYVAAGIRNLMVRKVNLQLRLGTSRYFDHTSARTLLFANCGELMGGLVLVPGAQVDDGWLDIVAIDTNAGILGWADLARQVVGQGLKIRGDAPWTPGTLDFKRIQRAEVRTDIAEHVQVDGDPMGRATGMTIRVDAEALTVRTP